jgi:hypothetical protein
MKELKKLIDIKSIVTLSLTLLFCYLAVVGKIDGAKVVEIFTIIMVFYFGTQFQKKVDEKDDTTK